MMIEKELKQKKTLSIVKQMFVALSLLVIVITAVSANDGTDVLMCETSVSDALNTHPLVADDTSQTQLHDKIDSLLESDNKPVFIYFYSKLCSFCEKQKPIIEELREECSDNISFIFVNVENPSFDLSGFDISGYPTVVVIYDSEKNLDGQYVNTQTFIGMTDKKKLGCAIESSLSDGTADYSPQPFIPEPVFISRINKSDFGKYNAVSSNWTVLADDVPPYCADFCLYDNPDFNYWLDTICNNPYCANDWRVHDIDGDGYNEHYLLVGDTYYQWGYAKAQTGVEQCYVYDFGYDGLDEHSYGCTESGADGGAVHKDYCGGATEYTYIKKSLTGTSNRLSSNEFFAHIKCPSGLHGWWGWYSWDLYWTPGGHTEYAMVLECGVDADCPGGQVCCKPTMSDPTSYYCAAQLSAPTLSAPNDACADTSYTISWNSVSGATSYKLYENGNNVYEGSELSRQFSYSSGSYTYYVQACNDCGCSGNSNSKTVSIKQKPSAPSLSAPIDACADTSYTVSWDSVSGATSYKLYENGNEVPGVSGLSKSFSHPSGSYTYYVQACNDCGCSGNSNSKTVSIKQKPSAPTLSAPIDACADTSYTVSWDSVSGATSYKLYENGNEVSGVSGLSKSFSHPSGSYTYYVQACNDCGCSGNSNSKTVSIKQNPDACFTTNPDPPDGCVPLTVAFDASCSAGEITSYSWDFGDDETGTGETVSHQYDDAGDYTAVLTVSGPCGTDTATKTVHVEDCEPFTNITICSATVVLGSTTTLDVMINNVTNAGAVELNLTYNPAVAQVTAAFDGDFDVTTKNLVHSADGYIRIIAYQTGEAGLNGNVLITTLTLEAMGVDASVLDLSGTKLSDNTPQQNNIYIELVNGTFITIPGAPSITSWSNDKTNDDSLNITLNESESVRFNATADQTITTWNWSNNGAAQSNTSDNYTTSWSTNGTYTVSVNATNANGTSDTKTWNITVSFTLHPGDIDGDGTVDVRDLRGLAAAFLSVPGAGNWNQCADLNCDGAINVLDLRILANNFFNTYE